MIITFSVRQIKFIIVPASLLSVAVYVCIYVCMYVRRLHGTLGRPLQARRLKMGRRRDLETSRGEVQVDSGGGEEEETERLSSSEQKDPLLDESVDPAVLARLFMLK